MKAKIICILIIMMLSLAIIPVIGIAEKSKICRNQSCDPSIDVEKYVQHPKTGEWIDADDEGVKFRKGETAMFRLIIENNGNCPLITISVLDSMGNDLVFLNADPYPDDITSDPVTQYLLWIFDDIVNPGDIIEILIETMVELKGGSGLANVVEVMGWCEHGIIVEDEDWCWVYVERNKEINNPFLNFLTSHPNMFPILQLLVKRLGLQ